MDSSQCQDFQPNIQNKKVHLPMVVSTRSLSQLQHQSNMPGSLGMLEDQIDF